MLLFQILGWMILPEKSVGRHLFTWNKSLLINNFMDDEIK
jgi:hypothetical protein